MHERVYFDLFVKGNKLFENNLVNLINVIEKQDLVKYVFEVDGETVTKKFVPPDNGGPWKRETKCTCRSCSIYGFTNRVSCKRRKAVERYLLEEATV